MEIKIYTGYHTTRKGSQESTMYTAHVEVAQNGEKLCDSSMRSCSPKTLADQVTALIKAFLESE